MLPGPCHGGMYTMETGIEKGSKEQMVLLVRPTPTQVPTNILYIPVNSHPCISYQVFDARGAALIVFDRLAPRRKFPMIPCTKEYTDLIGCFDWKGLISKVLAV